MVLGGTVGSECAYGKDEVQIVRCLFLSADQTTSSCFSQSTFNINFVERVVVSHLLKSILFDFSCSHPPLNPPSWLLSLML